MTLPPAPPLAGDGEFLVVFLAFRALYTNIPDQSSKVKCFGIGWLLLPRMGEVGSALFGNCEAICWYKGAGRHPKTPLPFKGRGWGKGHQIYQGVASSACADSQ